MLTRHDVILFDIDHTLINFTASSAQQVIWNGGVEVWAHYMTLLKETAENFERCIHYGIATAKSTTKQEFIGTKYAYLQGDILSAAILENEDFFPYYRTNPGLGPGLGLKRFINKDLVFFTNGKSKVQHALEAAFNKIKQTYGESCIETDSVIIIDDRYQVYRDAVDSGYSAICCGDLDVLSDEQKKRAIAKVFELAFGLLELPVPREILDVAEGVKPMEEEMSIDGESDYADDEELSEVDDIPNTWSDDENKSDDEEDRIFVVVDKGKHGKLKRMRLFDAGENRNDGFEEGLEENCILKKTRI